VRFDWDLRKKIPYSGLRCLTFDVAVAEGGTAMRATGSHGRNEAVALHRAAGNEDMPGDDGLTDDYRLCAARKKRYAADIESLIHHFINASRGMTPPRGECYASIERERETGYFVGFRRSQYSFTG